MPNIFDFAMMLINNNPQISNNPQAQQMIEAIKNHDNEQGAVLANNICNSYGIDKNQAIDNAKRFFNM